MKKKLLILSITLSIGQSFAAISQNDVNNAQNILTQLNNALTTKINLGNFGLSYKVSLENAIQIITNYAQENSKNFLGKYDIEILSAANTIRYATQQIITDCINSVEQLNRVDMTARNNIKNMIHSNITRLTQLLGSEQNKINKTHITISRQKAKKELIQAINSLILMLAQIRNIMSKTL